MNKDTYINLQLANIDNAIRLGKQVIKTSQTINNMKSKKEASEGGANAFFQDTMKYFNFNDAIASIEFLPLQVKDFKSQLVEIKIANDKMILEDEYIPEIDDELARIFLLKQLAGSKVNITAISDDVENAVKILEVLKEKLK